ncbi:MAG: tetratricopeptide repeat protein [Dysgonamonadaceae bacterium]|jgi:signal transduction histidine kinase|nr:tetratricopeptide repeat protein [Dysgonamonadaceae bacterium]
MKKVDLLSRQDTMKTKLVCILTGILLGPCVSMQAQSNVDSLVNVLNTQSPTVDEQLTVYIKLCSFYQLNDNEKYLFYAEKGLNLAKKEKNKFKMIEFNNFQGRAYSNKADYELAHKYFNTALNLAIEIKDRDLEIQTYGNLAVSYSNKGDLKTGIEYYQKALSCLESLGKEEKSATWLANIGGMYRLLGEYDLASTYLKKAESIAEKIDDKNALVKTYSSLGNLYREMEDLDKAMEYGLKSLKVSQDMHHKWGEANAYQTLADISINKEQYDEAEKYADECLRLAKEIENTKLIIVGWNALSNVYLYQNRYKEAEDAAFMAWKTDSTNLYIGMNIMSNITHSNISLGNKEKASMYLNKYTDLNNEYNNKNVRENLMEQEVKYETEKKELKIAAMEKDKILYMWIILLVTIVLVVLLLLYLNNKRLARQKIKQLEQEKQIATTKSVIEGETAERKRLARDLHDGLGGMLSAVKINLDNLDHIQNARTLLDSSIDELRRVARNLMPVSLLRLGLKASLEDFCGAFPQVDFQFYGEEKHTSENLELLIYRCVHELVNNAIKYSGAKHINVQMIQNENNISLTVHDDGCGFDPQKVKQGMGLKNLTDRLTVFNGALDIVSTPGNGTEVNVELSFP